VNDWTVQVIKAHLNTDFPADGPLTKQSLNAHEVTAVLCHHSLGLARGLTNSGACYLNPGIEVGIGLVVRTVIACIAINGITFVANPGVARAVARAAAAAATVGSAVFAGTLRLAAGAVVAYCGVLTTAIAGTARTVLTFGQFAAFVTAQICFNALPIAAIQACFALSAVAATAVGAAGLALALGFAALAVRATHLGFYAVALLSTTV
jgi:hypothetical protein